MIRRDERQTPPAWDLGEATVRSAPEQIEDGVWSFQGTLYTALTVQLFSKSLSFGHLTGENRNATTLMDQIPPGTRISTTVIAEPQYLIERHLTALKLAENHLNAATERTEQFELFAEELRLAQHALASITGEFTPDDLLGEIFGKFCIGK